MRVCLAKWGSIPRLQIFVLKNIFVRGNIFNSPGFFFALKTFLFVPENIFCARKKFQPPPDFCFCSPKTFWCSAEIVGHPPKFNSLPRKFLFIPNFLCHMRGFFCSHARIFCFQPFWASRDAVIKEMIRSRHFRHCSRSFKHMPLTIIRTNQTNRATSSPACVERSLSVMTSSLYLE